MRRKTPKFFPKIMELATGNRLIKSLQKTNLIAQNVASGGSR
jgi:hypothetical protein